MNDDSNYMPGYWETLRGFIKVVSFSSHSYLTWEMRLEVKLSDTFLQGQAMWAATNQHRGVHVTDRCCGMEFFLHVMAIANMNDGLASIYPRCPR